MLTKSGSKKTNKEISFHLVDTDMKLTNMPEDVPVDHAAIDTLQHVFTHIMGWKLDLPTLTRI